MQMSLILINNNDLLLYLSFGFFSVSLDFPSIYLSNKNTDRGDVATFILQYAILPFMSYDS